MAGFVSSEPRINEIRRFRLPEASSTSDSASPNEEVENVPSSAPLDDACALSMATRFEDGGRSSALRAATIGTAHFSSASFFACGSPPSALLSALASEVAIYLEMMLKGL